MAISDRIKELRQARGYSQEYIAEILNVSRQAVSKWESGRVYPDIENIMALSELFGVTTDYLLKDAPSTSSSTQYKDSDDKQFSSNTSQEARTVVLNINGTFGREFKSKTKLFGVPLVHINVGFGRKKVAKGIIAIGNVSIGVFSLGLVSVGGISIGLVSLGLLAFGVLALGLLSYATVAIGLMAFGAIAIGYVATGAVAIGVYASGAVALASKVAIGSYAEGHVAIGRTVNGVKELIDSGAGNSFPSGMLRRDEVQSFIKEVYPNISNFILNLLTFWFRK